MGTAKSRMSAALTVEKEMKCEAAKLWARVGQFQDLSWSGPDPWVCLGPDDTGVEGREEIGATRELEEHGMKEELVAKGEMSYTYKMLEGPFENFTVVLSVVGGEGTSTIKYDCTGDLNEEQQEMVKKGTGDVFEALTKELEA